MHQRNGIIVVSQSKSQLKLIRTNVTLNEKIYKREKYVRISQIREFHHTDGKDVQDSNFDISTRILNTVWILKLTKKKCEVYYWNKSCLV